MASQKLIPFIDDEGKRREFFFEDEISKYLYFVKKHAGRRIKFTCKVKRDQFSTAQRYANKEFNRRIGKTGVVRTLIKDETGMWLKVKESEGLAYDTMNNVRRAKNQIDEYWGSMFPSEITRDNLVDWYDWWKVKYPDIDMENAIKYMRNFCRYLAEKVVDGRPLLPVVPSIADPNYKTIRRRRKKKKERIISAAEFKTILEKAESDDHRIVVLFMYTMASRISETLELRFNSEIILDQEPIYKWSDGQNKADLDNWHYLHPSLIEPIKQLAARRKAEKTDRLFPQKLDNTKPLREQMIDWAGWRQRANLGWHWTPHTFRHTCLSNLTNDPKNPQALICKLYRVSLAVLLETYFKVNEQGREVMRAPIKVEP